MPEIQLPPGLRKILDEVARKTMEEGETQVYKIKPNGALEKIPVEDLPLKPKKQEEE